MSQDPPEVPAWIYPGASILVITSTIGRMEEIVDLARVGKIAKNSFLIEGTDTRINLRNLRSSDPPLSSSSYRVVNPGFECKPAPWQKIGEGLTPPIWSSSTDSSMHSRAGARCCGRIPQNPLPNLPRMTSLKQSVRNQTAPEVAMMPNIHTAPLKFAATELAIFGDSDTITEILAEAANIEARLAEVTTRTAYYGHPIPVRTGLGFGEQVVLDQARAIRGALRGIEEMVAV